MEAEDRDGCILHLLGVLILICSFVRLVGGTVSIFFFHQSHSVFVASISMGTLFLVLLFVYKEKLRRKMAYEIKAG